MVVGFNHNFRYKGEVFHVQTEDGGLNTTNIITLLYRGGTILARQKTATAKSLPLGVFGDAKAISNYDTGLT